MAACAALQKIARRITVARKATLTWQLIQETACVSCAPELSALLGRAVKKCLPRAIELPSGAGHDAAIMAGIAPMAMLFIRCQNGLSHHPDESVKVRDAQIALEVMNDFLQSLAQEYEAAGGKRLAKTAGNMVKPDYE